MTRKFSLLKLGCKRESSQTERKSHARGHRSKRQPRQNGTNSVSDGLIPAIGDEPSVSNAQLPAHQAKDDQSAHASWDSPDAPVTLLKPRCSGFEDYKSRLQLRHRCTVVACNDRGAQCVAVATAEERAAGIIMHDTQFEHGLCVPLTFHETPDSPVSQHCIFLCSCSKMRVQIQAVQGMGKSSRPRLAEFEQQLGLCWHARAVKAIVLADEDWARASKPEDAYDYITDVELQHDCVQLISWNGISKDHLALSVGTHASGWPRAIVGSDTAGNLVCRDSACCRMPDTKHKCCHCKCVCLWQKALDQELNMLEDTENDPARLNRLSALAAKLEGFQLLD